MAKIAEFTLTNHLTVHGFSQHSKKNVPLNNNEGGSVLGSEIWGTVTREKRRIYRKTDRLGMEFWFWKKGLPLSVLLQFNLQKKPTTQMKLIKNQLSSWLKLL